ncbi:sigma-54-dependent transcriptional regulator [Trichlorobacter lovleyi]|uniref:Two component, sigma54 specific, transcriptional regulator, Fis family n=1 Tax=Trichlorobacter lovleyi (strain ATCC BAA-1151 / DSM 17278 / SZ) TaxID=398767 RepID=B3E2W4_TRIL1|nr:sigma-54 dependent transcriptional regulator [Trichlorobacter lovleyi]ACD97224.1 two component, sigma54 specific, transcriptional regulator, Fis family [Trichlorobacter lovleyi SZ]
MKTHILLVEDDVASRFGFIHFFSREGYAITEATGIAEATEAIAGQRFDAVILDNNLPDGNGIDFISTVRTYDGTVPIIIITGTADIPLAVEAMQRGADNFLTKPVDNAGLSAFLKKTLEIGVLKRRVVARQRLEKQEEMFWGNSAAMRQAFDLARIAAESDSPVLLTGETGTGKGMIAKWIHRNSSRSDNEFVEVNCSCLRGELLAREIFGNARGAFTSADQDRKGLLDIADRGTLFLDEIGDMGLEVQAQFLKVLEEKTYRRLGDVKLLRSNFRLICATNREIANLLKKGLFRQDLLFRINLITIAIPPLRQRMEDLPAIIAAILRSLGRDDTSVGPEIMALLRGYTWPGNFRELHNVLERAHLLARGGSLLPAYFFGLNGAAAPLPASAAPVPRALKPLDMQQIQQALDEADGCVEKAAALLNVSRATLYRRLKQNGE